MLIRLRFTCYNSRSQTLRYDWVIDCIDREDAERKIHALQESAEEVSGVRQITYWTRANQSFWGAGGFDDDFHGATFEGDTNFDTNAALAALADLSSWFTPYFGPVKPQKIPDGGKPEEGW